MVYATITITAQRPGTPQGLDKGRARKVKGSEEKEPTAIDGAPLGRYTALTTNDERRSKERKGVGSKP